MDQKAYSAVPSQDKIWSHVTEDPYDPFQIRPSAYGGAAAAPAPSKHEAEHPQRPKSMAWLMLKGWLPELVWCLLSIASLISLAMVLKRYDGKHLPNWPSGITLNVVIALLATLCRAAFIAPVMEAIAQYKWLYFKRSSGAPLRDFSIFESASRGPWGSIQLVFVTKARAIGLMAALLLLSALLTATITQSAITYVPRAVAASKGDGDAVIRRTEKYFWAAANQNAQIARSAPIYAAVTRALYSEGLIGYDTPFCRTSNCTWPEGGKFSTLGVCSDVKNVTSRLRIEEPKDESFALTNATLPNGLKVTKSMAGFGDVLIELGPTLSFNSTQQQKSKLWSGFVLQARRESEDLVFRASEILLHWCVKTYRLSVTDNVPSIELVATETNVHREEMVVPGSTFEEEMMFLNSSHDPGQKYIVDGHGPGYMTQALDNNLVGHWTDFGGPEYKNGTEAFAAAMHSLTIFSIDPNMTLDEGTGAAQQNVTSNLASVLTNMLFDKRFNGTAWTTETFVKVRWEWLTMLVVQIALSMLTLLFVMFETARHRMDIVKTSPLPILFAIPSEQKYAWEQEMQNKRVNSNDERMTVATGVAGKLHRNGTTWAIR